MANHAVTMYNYHVWANQTIFHRLKELPQEIYTREIQSAFPSVAKTMSHIYTVDLCWLHILSGKNMSEAMTLANQDKEEMEAKSIEDLEEAFSRLSERYKAFIEEQADLEQTIILDNPFAGLRETSFAEILMQVANHGSYHRGNIGTMLRQVGHSTVMTDYALYWYAH